ncbi:MAG: DUF2280 domain-containing protein [Pyrinomonadaceae bacterium]
MAALRNEVKVFIVKQFAKFKSPTDIATLVNDVFGIQMTRQRVFKYDPERADAHQKWKDLFDQCRKEFLAQIEAIPVANQAVRLQELQESLNRAKRSPRINEILVHSILEQAAKEVGGIYTNHRRLSGKDGEPLLDVNEIANAVYRDLVTDNGWSAPDAVKFVAERYKIPETVLISDASN